ncbi:MAG: hypothetical protein ABFC92_05115 [Rectinema sp.]
MRSIEIIPVQYRITAAVVQCDIRLDIRVGHPAVRQPTGSAARGGLCAVWTACARWTRWAACARWARQWGKCEPISKVTDF